MGDTGIGMVISGVMSDEAGGSTYSVTVTGVSLQGDQMARAAHGSPVKWTSFKVSLSTTGLAMIGSLLDSDCRSSIEDNFFFTFGNSEGRTVL